MCAGNRNEKSKVLTSATQGGLVFWCFQTAMSFCMMVVLCFHSSVGHDGCISPVWILHRYVQCLLVWLPLWSLGDAPAGLVKELDCSLLSHVNTSKFALVRYAWVHLTVHIPLTLSNVCLKFGLIGKKHWFHVCPPGSNIPESATKAQHTPWLDTVLQ